jgi:hypothetical protein
MFEVCKFVLYHTIQINHQLDATIFPVYYPDVYLQVNIFRAGRPEHEQTHGYYHDAKVKPEAAIAVAELLMMGVRTPEKC